MGQDEVSFFTKCALFTWRAFLLPEIIFFGIFRIHSLVFNARVAQLVEHSTDTREVPGSNPGTRTIKNRNSVFLCRAKSSGRAFVRIRNPIELFLECLHDQKNQSGY